jgi:uncharacterized protein
MNLEAFFKDNPLVALGFSGGVDSSYLLYSGIRSGANIKAYFVKTQFQPEFELRDAHRLAEQIGAEITVIEKNILSNAKIISNPHDRCYFCKRFLFEALRTQALADGIRLVIDGTNASDIENRPGTKALRELSVRSPLRECGITKSDIRGFLKEAGLFTHDKPAYTCLATRIPPSRPITKELLDRVEKAEEVLFNLGFNDFRIRIMDDAAKLQILPEQIANIFEKRVEITTAIKPYFPTVLLDLKGRHEKLL